MKPFVQITWFMVVRAAGPATFRETTHRSGPKNPEFYPIAGFLTSQDA
jgi:hypothetical protein